MAKQAQYENKVLRDAEFPVQLQFDTWHIPEPWALPNGGIAIHTGFPRHWHEHIEIHHILEELDSGEYGKVLRAKGIVNGESGAWIEFDYVPEEHEVRAGHPDYTGRLCVIGAELDEHALHELFGL